MTPAEIIDEHALIAWAKTQMKLPGREFTAQDMEMFMLGYGACLAEVSPLPKRLPDAQTPERFFLRDQIRPLG
jgi:hypothetical protein